MCVCACRWDVGGSGVVGVEGSDIQGGYECICVFVISSEWPLNLVNLVNGDIPEKMYRLQSAEVSEN